MTDDDGYREECCWNYPRDQCKGLGCVCRCHQPTPQAAYVAAWRAEHPEEVYTSSWGCPLCGAMIQTKNNQAILPNVIRSHQDGHADDWERYQAAGADRATVGEGD